MADADDLLALAPDLISSPRVRAALEDRIIELIDEVFDTVQDTLETGDSASRLAMVKTTLPLLLKVSRDSEGVDTEDIEAMRAETRAAFTAAGDTLKAGDG